MAKGTKTHVKWALSYKLTNCTNQLTNPVPLEITEPDDKGLLIIFFKFWFWWEGLDGYMKMEGKGASSVRPTCGFQITITKWRSHTGCSTWRMVLLAGPPSVLHSGRSPGSENIHVLRWAVTWKKGHDVIFLSLWFQQNKCSIWPVGSQKMFYRKWKFWNTSLKKLSLHLLCRLSQEAGKTALSHGLMW